MAPNPIADDPRIDPRIKAMFAPMGDLARLVPERAVDRDELLARAAGEEAVAQRQTLKAFLDMCDIDEVAPSHGLSISEHDVVSQPDGNPIKLRFIRPEGRETVPCVYYIHGGGMQVMSCYDGNYRAWGRMIAHEGVAVAMVDFRNCLAPSSVPEANK